MKKLTQLNSNDLKKVVGGKYYGNGLYCGKHKCRVNWSQAWGCSVNRWAAAAATGGKATIGHC